MGSPNDAPVMQGAVDVLKELGISVEMTVASAHRSPERVMRLLGEAETRGVKVFIVGAGAAAHLGGVVAAHVTKPVIGVPIDSSALNGLDALLSTVQMPPGVPVATVSIGKPGATNAGVLAAQILALGDAGIAERVEKYKRGLAEKVEEAARKLWLQSRCEIFHRHVRLPREPGGLLPDRGAVDRRRRYRAAETRDADLVVVNTCSVTSAADQGARQIIRKIARENPNARIVVTGCYATRRPDEIAALPGVVQIVPNERKEDFVAGNRLDHGSTVRRRRGRLRRGDCAWTGRPDGIHAPGPDRLRSESAPTASFLLLAEQDAAVR